MLKSKVPPSSAQPPLNNNNNYPTNPYGFVDFNNHMVNEHRRFIPNSQKIGHAYFVPIDDSKALGQTTYHVMQFPSPSVPGNNANKFETDPEVMAANGPDNQYQDVVAELRPLINIHEATHPQYKMTRLQAQTPNGTMMKSQRHLDIHFSINGTNTKTKGRLYLFSPINEEYDFWGSAKKLPFWKEPIEEKIEAIKVNGIMPTREKKPYETDPDHDERERTRGIPRNLKSGAFVNTLLKLPVIYKGGKFKPVYTHDTATRDGAPRGVTQNKVMDKTSAVKAFERFMVLYQRELSEEMQEKFEASVQAPLYGLFHSNKRPEWLHLYAHSLYLLSKNPQMKKNLAAAPKWANTDMMVQERVVKWYSLNRPEAEIYIKSYFEMLMDTEILAHLNFHTKISENGMTVEAVRDIDPFTKVPTFRKASDIAQLSLVTFDLLNKVDASLEQVTLKKPILFEATVPEYEEGAIGPEDTMELDSLSSDDDDLSNDEGIIDEDDDLSSCDDDDDAKPACKKQIIEKGKKPMPKSMKKEEDSDEDVSDFLSDHEDVEPKDFKKFSAIAQAMGSALAHGHNASKQEKSMFKQSEYEQEVAKIVPEFNPNIKSIAGPSHTGSSSRKLVRKKIVDDNSDDDIKDSDDEKVTNPSHVSGKGLLIRVPLVVDNANNASNQQPRRSLRINKS